jgi:hypothetical protein
MDSSEVVTNLQFEARVNRLIPASARVKAFYAKVAGAGHTASGGTPHAAVIEKCNTFDILRLEPSSESPLAPNAVAVVNEAGQQIGFLDSRAAGEAARNARRGSSRWITIFRHSDHHPETGAIVGAVVYMVFLTEQFAREQEKKGLPRPSAAF